LISSFELDSEFSAGYLTTEGFGTALISSELIVVIALELVVGTMLKLEVKMTFTLKVTVLVGDVATRSKYFVPTSFSLVEKTCS
jgi:hypothetical protein